MPLTPTYTVRVVADTETTPAVICCIGFWMTTSGFPLKIMDPCHLVT